MLFSLLHALGLAFFSLAWFITDHFRPWSSFQSEAMALWALALLAWAHVAQPALWARQTSRWAGGLLVLALLPWLQWVLGIGAYAGDAWMGSLFLCALAVAVSLGYSWGVAPVQLEMLQKTFFLLIVLVGLLTATTAVLQWLSLDFISSVWMVIVEPGSRSAGNLGQPNQTATLILMGLAALAWAYERGLTGGVGLAVGAAWMAVAVGTTQSRAAVLSVVVVSGFLLVHSHYRSLRLRPLHIVGWLAFLGLWMGVLQPGLSDLLLMSGPRIFEVGVDGARVTIWSQMLHGIWHSPWVGYGVSATPTANAWGALQVQGNFIITHAHSIVLDLLAWFGIPLGMLLTAVAAYWFVTRMLRVRHALGIYAMACVLPVLVHSLVEYPYAYGYFWVASGLFIGLVEADYPAATATIWPRSLGLVLLAFWTAAGAVMTWEYVQIEEDFRYVRFEGMNMGSTPPEHRPPKVRLLTHLDGMLVAGRQKPSATLPQAALDNLRDASLRFPFPILRSRYARALWLRGDVDAASLQLGMMRGMYGEAHYQGTLELMRGDQVNGQPPLPPVPLLPLQKNAPAGHKPTGQAPAMLQ